MYKEVTLRLAGPGDADLLKDWDSRPHVKSARGADDQVDWKTELSRQPDWQELLIAETDNRPVGFMQIIDPEKEESHYWGDTGPGLRAIDIWIGEESDLGRGYGTQMMQLAIKRCFKNTGVTAILVDPLVVNRDAQRFYRRLGFKPVERRVFGNDECLVMRLDRPA